MESLRVSLKLFLRDVTEDNMTHMRDHWLGKNVNLDALVELLKQFFEEKKFRVSVENTSKEYKIRAAPKSGSQLVDILEIIVRGEPDDFWVEFGTESDNTKVYKRYGGLAQLCGGGFFLSKGLKSQEEFDRLEREFWNFIDEKLASLEQPR